MIQTYVTDDMHRLTALDISVIHESESKSIATIAVDLASTYQDVLGFGAAFTDAACYVISQLEPETRGQLMSELFSPTAMSLNTCRVPVGASDYARYCYSYDDIPDDIELRHFSIDHDREYIIPVIQQAKGLNPELFLFSSPWSPPGWMKTGGSMTGGWMRQKYLDVYAHYYIKFLLQYAEAGIPIDALTPQNEVETDQFGAMPACLWHPEMELEFVRDHLAPLLRENNLQPKIWIVDHNYIHWTRAKWMLDEPGVREVVDGVAFHGYQGTPDMMSRLVDAHPGIHLYWTEGGPDLGETYDRDWCRWGITFTEAMNNWCRSITAWNLALDDHGNPNIGPFPCAGLVTVVPETQSVTYSGQFWALGHFSRFVKRGAVRVASVLQGGSDIAHIAFVNPDGECVVILTNEGVAIDVQVSCGSTTGQLRLPQNSIVTLTFQVSPYIDHKC